MKFMNENKWKVSLKMKVNTENYNKKQEKFKNLKKYKFIFFSIFKKIRIDNKYCQYQSV